MFFVCFLFLNNGETRLSSTQWCFDARKTCLKPTAASMHPACAKSFCWSACLLLKIAFFAAHCFQNSLFYKTALFEASEALYTKSSKVFGLWRLRPQSRTADARSCASRRNSLLFTLRFSGIQILFHFLVPGKLEPQRRFFVTFVSSVIQRQFHFVFSKIDLCIHYVRLP